MTAKKEAKAKKISTARYLIGSAEKQAVMRFMDRSIKEGLAFDRYGGTEVDAYEKEFAAHVGCAHATAVSSGTAAIHAAVAALHLEPGSEIIVPPITDPGGVMPAVMQQLIPVFADTEPGGFNVSAAGIEKAITRRTSAIMVAHIAGEACDMGAIMKVARRHNLPVIEDCAQAHDAEYKGKLVGQFGTLSAFSLMSGKHHTSGGQGGMVLGNDAALILEAKRFADRGKPFVAGQRSNLFVGLNYRMTDLEACIGRVQLRRLPGFIQTRRRRAETFRKAMKGLRTVQVMDCPCGRPAYWFLRIAIREDRIACTRAEYAAKLVEAGLPVMPTYTSLIYRQKWLLERATFGKSGLPWSLSKQKYDYEGSCPNAEKAIANQMIMTCHEGMSDATMRRCADLFREVEGRFAK